MNVFRKNPYILFILPAFILYTIFVIYPLISAIPYSFTEWSGLGDKKFVGLDNYIKLFTDPRFSTPFYHALYNNLRLTILGFVVLIPIIVLLAYLIFRKIPGHKAFQVIIFSPHFVNFITLGFLVTLFFDPRLGLLSKIVKLLGLNWNTANLFTDPDSGVYYVLLVNGWYGIGYSMLIVIANFATIPKEIQEAAVIDGAGEWRCFWHIFLPLLRPSLINIIIITYIWSISVFEIPYVLGGQTGGVNGSMDFIALFFYRTAFSGGEISNSMGMGTTIAVVMFILISIGAIIQLQLLKRKQTDFW